MLQRRIGKLEEENVQLRHEASFLAEQTDEVEQEEQRLVSDFVSQLANARSDLTSITEEAEKYREEYRIFKRLSDNLQEKLQQAEQKLAKVRSVNRRWRRRRQLSVAHCSKLRVFFVIAVAK